MKGARLVSEKESRKVAKDIGKKMKKFSEGVLGRGNKILGKGCK